MNFLLKLSSRMSLPSRSFSALATKPSLTLVDNKTTTKTTAAADLFSLTKRHMYTFRLSNKIVRNKHATRPKKTNNNSVELTYEQAQFAEKIGVSKSWNSWNTSNLLDGKRQAESTYEDFYIRKFLYGTFSGLFASEIIIKRRFNTIDISFLANLPRAFYPEKVYFLVGYTEELLSNLLKCVVKVNVQTIKSKRDLVFRNW